MHPGVFDVFRHGVDDQASLVGHGVDIDFLCVVDELGDDNGVIRRDVGGSRQEVIHGGFVPYNVHGGTGKDVRRSDKDRVTI